VFDDWDSGGRKVVSDEVCLRVYVYILFRFYS